MASFYKLWILNHCGKGMNHYKYEKEQLDQRIE